MAQNIYDRPEFFAGYSRLDRSVRGLDGAPEWPAMRALLPDLGDKRILDLGCGFGWFARWAMIQGAASVVGVDLSENMLSRARVETADPAVRYIRADLESLDLPENAFDLAYSSLALHYVEDFGGSPARWRARSSPPVISSSASSIPSTRRRCGPDGWKPGTGAGSGRSIITRSKAPGSRIGSPKA